MLAVRFLPAGCSVEFPFVTSRPDLAAIVYESSGAPLPDFVGSARIEIERAGVQFRVVDKDVKDGDGNIPKEIEPSIAAAVSHGLPALTVQSTGRVLKVIDLPKSKEELVKAIIQ